MLKAPSEKLYFIKKKGTKVAVGELDVPQTEVVKTSGIYGIGQSLKASDLAKTIRIKRPIRKDIPIGVDTEYMEKLREKSKLKLSPAEEEKEMKRKADEEERRGKEIPEALERLTQQSALASTALQAAIANLPAAQQAQAQATMAQQAPAQAAPQFQMPPGSFAPTTPAPAQAPASLSPSIFSTPVTVTPAPAQAPASAQAPPSYKKSLEADIDEILVSNASNANKKSEVRRILALSGLSYFDANAMLKNKGLEGIKTEAKFDELVARYSAPQVAGKGLEMRRRGKGRPKGSKNKGGSLASIISAGKKAYDVGKKVYDIGKKVYDIAKPVIESEAGKKGIGMVQKKLFGGAIAPTPFFLEMKKSSGGLMEEEKKPHMSVSEAISALNEEAPKKKEEMKVMAPYRFTEFHMV
jgi:hypothetical protein